MTSKINFEDSESEQDSITTRDSFASFYAESSIASYKKEYSEDSDYYNDAIPTKFGVPLSTIGIEKSYAQTTSESNNSSPKATDISELTNNQEEIIAKIRQELRLEIKQEMLQEENQLKKQM